MHRNDFSGDGPEFPACSEELRTAFYRSIEIFEHLDEQPKRPIGEMFPGDFQFPDCDRMSAEELAAKIDEIEEILAGNNIHIAIVNDLPDAVLYRYLVDEVIAKQTAFPPNNTRTIECITGCNGDCPRCFQRDYCETAREIEQQQKNRPAKT